MQINLKSSSGKLTLFSPLFSIGDGQSPYLSPLPENALLKQDNESNEFMNFRLQSNPMANQPMEQEDPEAENQQLLREQVMIDNYQLSAAIKMPHDSDCDGDNRRDSKSHSMTKSHIQLIVQFLVANSFKKEEILLEDAEDLIGQSNQLYEIFGILMTKFKKLKKTKEEMTKYCMRKAFKFIADRMKKERTHARDVDTCMKAYFSKGNSQNFSIPFKKNSTEKTMNGNFLKRVFTANSFVDDYREFLKEFKELMEEDNLKKVKYLAELIEEYLSTHDVKKVESIKRLPWTRQTLEQTESLGHSLIGYADSNEASIGYNRKKKIDQQ